jgi:hypothetical protein
MDVPIDRDLLAEVPPPVLLNTWKHHAGALRQRIARSAREGEAALECLAQGLVMVGTDLMDLYVGSLVPMEIAQGVIAELARTRCLEPDLYQSWLESQGGYGMLSLAADDSRWVLRRGDDVRYVHVHQARWAPGTRRVRANVLKTAVMALPWAAISHGDPLNVRLINTMRRQNLDLSPIGRLFGEDGIAAVIELLRPAGSFP